MLWFIKDGATPLVKGQKSFINIITNALEFYSTRFIVTGIFLFNIMYLRELNIESHSYLF